MVRAVSYRYLLLNIDGGGPFSLMKTNLSTVPTAVGPSPYYT